MCVYIHTYSHIYTHTCMYSYTYMYKHSGILLGHKNEIMSFAATWMDLKIIILREVSQKEKEIPHNIIYMWSRKYETHELIYEQKQTQRHRE